MSPIVLCIDEREPNLTTERRILEVAGYHVFCAANSEQAEQLLARHSVDVVLLSEDLLSDEAAVCARLRKLQPWVRIVLQKTVFFDPAVPSDADVAIPKTTHPKEKLRIIDSLLTQEAA